MDKSLLIDTNLLILLVVGSVDQSLISSHKRLRKFESSDLDILLRLMSNFKVFWTTPHILAETSNLIVDGISGPLKNRIMEELLMISGHMMRESHYPTRLLLNSPICKYACELGIPDAIILLKLHRNAHLVTDDLPLYHVACNEYSSKAVNFEHLRQSYWGNF